jgi:hypothetical protein
MQYHYEPIKVDSQKTFIDLDGYEEKEGLDGPFRLDGIVVYFDYLVGKLLNPKTNSYIK